MSAVDVLGPPVNDPVSEDFTPVVRCRAPELVPNETTTARAGQSRRIVLVVATALIMGIAIGWLAAESRQDNAPTGPEVTAPGLPVEVAGSAVLSTTLHLSSQSEGADRSAGVWVNRAEAVSGTQLDEHTWQVDVAIDALELTDGRYRAAGLQYFSVLVSLVDGRPSRTGPPARIPVPSTAVTKEASFSGPVGDDQAATAIGFLDEYLTRGSELSRYLANPGEIDRFETAPYRRIETHVVGTNSLGQIKVAITATAMSGITHQLQYVLTMAFSGDVWMVDQISPAA